MTIPQQITEAILATVRTNFKLFIDPVSGNEEMAVLEIRPWSTIRISIVVDGTENTRAFSGGDIEIDVQFFVIDPHDPRPQSAVHVKQVEHSTDPQNPSTIETTAKKVDSLIHNWLILHKADFLRRRS